MKSNAKDSVKPLRWLILGGGAVVSNLHLPALAALGWLGAATVVEPDKSMAEKVLLAFPGIDLVATPFEDAIAAGDTAKRFDAALIAVPNSLHEAAARQALEAGLHVLCEKPLALDSATCEELGRAATAAQRILGVAMARRFLPSIQAARAAMADGLIGDLVEVEMQDGGNVASWPWDSDTVLRRDQGGALVNLGVHFLDYLELLVGALAPDSYADDAAGGIEVNFKYQLRNLDRVPVSLQVSWTHALKNELRLVGTTGVLVLGKDNFEACRWESPRGRLNGRLTVSRPFESGNWRPTLESCFVEQFWHFARAVEAGKPAPVGAAAAAGTLRLIEWAYSNRSRPGFGPSLVTAESRPALEPGQVVVTGGTGFVGSTLVERLAGLGFRDIAVPVRSFRTGAAVARFPVQMHRADVLDQVALQRSMRGARYVFHLAYGTDGPEAYLTTVKGSVNVVRAAIEVGAESVVVFSTCTVYGQPDEIVTEDTLHRPSLGDYGRAKSEMERQCLEIARQSAGTRIVIIQPGTVYGPLGKTFTELPCRLASQGSFCWIAEGRGLVNYVYVDNLVDAAILAASSPEASGERFIVVDGCTSWRDFLAPIVAPWMHDIGSLTAEDVQQLSRIDDASGLRDIARAALSSPELMHAMTRHPVLGRVKQAFTTLAPASHKKLQAMRVAPEMILPAPQPRARPPAWLADLFGHSLARYSAAKAQRVLGWQPKIQLAEGQANAISWLRWRGIHPVA